MNLDQFREAVRAEFGDQMEHVTPEHMRQFICRMYAQLNQAAPGEGGITLASKDAHSYEQIVIEFLSNTLDSPGEHAFILLWLFSCEMFFAQMGDDCEQRFAELLSLDLPGQDSTSTP